MAGLDIRNLPEAVIAYHRHRAAASGQDWEDVVAQRLIAEAQQNRRQLFDMIDGFHAAIEARYGATGTVIGAISDIRALRSDRESRRSLRRGV
jgi:plasmid stability protein